jgi:tetratricopeptide (TPR) repeat protein
MATRFLYSFIILITISACIETQSSKGYKNKTAKKYTIPKSDIEVDSNTVFTLFRTPLPPKQFSGREGLSKQKELLKAQEIHINAPNDISKNILYGRRLADIGLYYEAIKIFSEGLDVNPTSFRLLRHRGQRYITIRQFDLAIEDLQRAAFYSRPAKNETEYEFDGNNPEDALTNDKFNIYYYLGIAHFLKGNYDKAISSFKKCQSYATNNDLLVALTHWFYLTYRKIGNETSALQLLAPISKRMKVIKNSDYLNLLLVFKGALDAETALANAENENKSLNPRIGFGVAHWYLFKGDIDKSTRIFDLVLLNDRWESVEYIATESYLKNTQGL